MFFLVALARVVVGEGVASNIMFGSVRIKKLYFRTKTYFHSFHYHYSLDTSISTNVCPCNVVVVGEVAQYGTVRIKKLYFLLSFHFITITV
jgi:hypothetical protein